MGFGIHEALDQFGALCGPLLIAIVLALHHTYNQSFVVLAVPGPITLSLVIVARVLHPKPHELEAPGPIAISVPIQTLRGSAFEGRQAFSIVGDDGGATPRRLARFLISPLTWTICKAIHV